MKVETPQILWHDTHNMSNKDNGKSFPILSCHLIDSSNASVLATAGGCEINLWRVACLPDCMRGMGDDGTNILIKPPHHYSAADEGHTQIQHLLTLSRGTNERTINCVRFSPDYKHLAAVGDGGLVVAWTLPNTCNANAAQWAALSEEKDLKFKIIYNQSDDVMDLSWSADSKRFSVCSLDHTVAVFERDDTEWKSVFRSSKDHSHYVQGVAFDPKGVYMASQGSDRTVKVYARKAKEVDDLTKKFELGKAKTIKSFHLGEKEKKHLFADELTLGSFFRRLAFTPDGAFLVVPAALWHGDAEQVVTEGGQPASPNSVDKLNEASFGTYLFARHCFEKPYKVLAGLDKPSVVVRPNPLLFQLTHDTTDRCNLPHRSIFAILTVDTVLIYDTIHDKPLAVARGLHYAGLTDAAWSKDGKTLFVTSSDGYVSILSFANGELGKTLEKEEANSLTYDKKNDEMAPRTKKKVTLNLDANITTEIENVRDLNPAVNILVPKKKKKIGPTDVAETSANILVPKKKAKLEAKEDLNLMLPKKLADTPTQEAGSSL